MRKLFAFLLFTALCFAQYQAPGSAGGGGGASNFLTLANGGTATEILTYYNTTASTGVTLFKLRLGAGQGTTEVMRFNNNADTTVAVIRSDFGLQADAGVRDFNQNSYFLGTNVSGLQMKSTYLVQWGNGSVGTVDSGFGRNGAGIIEVNNGTLGTFRDLKARQLIEGTVTVGTLQTCNGANEGAHAAVTDSNAASFTVGIGAVVAAGGTTHVPVYCDGTNWRIG